MKPAKQIPLGFLALAATAAVAVVLTACGFGPEEVRRQPAEGTPAAPSCADCNVILISLDTLRPDRMSLYGYERPTTPRLEALAADGVVFDNAYHSGGGTLPSHMSLMTGLNPHAHKVGPQNQKPLPAARVTLAESLAAAGFATAAFVDGGWMSAKFGFDQGFATYDEEGGRFASILPKAYDWLAAHASQPFFLFLHTYDVHSEWERLPYDCPGDYSQRYTAGLSTTFDGCRGDKCASKYLAWVNSGLREGRFTADEQLAPEELEYIRSLYDGCINYVDDEVGKLVAWLQDRGLYEKSLLVVTSDHGEEFLEHGRLLHEQGGYEELSRVPLVMKFPGGAHAGQRVDAIAAIVDVMPTILDALALPLPEEAQGHSLMPAVAEGKPVRDAVHMYSVLRTERWKYLSDSKELYDLAADPGEQNNVYVDHPEVVAQLESQVRGLVRQDQRVYERLETTSRLEEEVQLTPEEIEGLKALGYLN